jgi:hypothetical protein
MLRESSLDGDHACLHEEASAMTLVNNISPSGSIMVMGRYERIAPIVF